MVMPIKKPGPSAEIIQNSGGRLGNSWQYWLDQLLLELWQSLTPPGAILVIDPTVVDVATEFPAARGGLGRLGGPYEWWALCDGNNSTPDLSGTDLEVTNGLRYIMRVT